MARDGRSLVLLTPEFLFPLQRYPEILRLLLDQGADKESVDDFGITPLFVAAQYRRLECLRILISYGNS